MRLFIAIPLPKGIKEILRTVQQKISKESGTYSMVEPENIHLTLKFLGETPEKEVRKIADAIQKIKFSSFTLSLSIMGVFPSEKYARVIWVGLKESRELHQLHEQIEEIMQQCGFPKETEFAAHLTIARVKTVKNKEIFMESIRKINVDEKEFPVSSICLISSTLTSKGQVYETIEEYNAS